MQTNQTSDQIRSAWTCRCQCECRIWRKVKYAYPYPYLDYSTVWRWKWNGNDRLAFSLLGLDCCSGTEELTLFVTDSWEYNQKPIVE